MVQPFFFPTWIVETNTTTRPLPRIHPNWCWDMRQVRMRMDFHFAIQETLWMWYSPLFQARFTFFCCWRLATHTWTTQLKLSFSSTGSNLYSSSFQHIFHLTLGSRALRYCKRKADMLWHPLKQVLVSKGPVAVWAWAVICQFSQLCSVGVSIELSISERWKALVVYCSLRNLKLKPNRSFLLV